jgi:hypothetical protein
MWGERRVAPPPRRDAEPVVVGDRLGQRVALVVEQQLAVAVVVVAGLVAGVGDPVRRAGPSAVGGPEHLVAGARGVGREEDLVPAGARQPWPIALAAVDRPLRPRSAAVGGREQRVVDEVDAGVVDPAALVLRQVGV